MQLVHLLTKQIIISRKIATTGDKLALSTVTSAMVNLQPITDSSREIAEGIFGKSFKIYCSGDIDLSPGDRLRDTATGDTYTVVSDGVTRRTMGCIDYVIAVIQKTKN